MKDPNIAYAATLSFAEVGPVIMDFLQHHGYISRQLWESWHAKNYSGNFAAKDGELIFQVLKQKTV